MNAFEFAVLSSLRATQLNRGCTPRVPPSEKVAVTAQHEVAERKIVKSPETAPPHPDSPSTDRELDVSHPSD
jgi:DNA-directed RNA polymerase subunit K/omega